MVTLCDDMRSALVSVFGAEFLLWSSFRPAFSNPVRDPTHPRQGET